MMNTSNRQQKSANMPAKNPGSKLFRETPKGLVITQVAKLRDLTLEQAMLSALTSAGLKLTMEIDSGGTRVFLADSRDNRIVGNEDDLQKLSAMRTFIQKEKKDSVSLEALDDVSNAAWVASSLAQGDENYQQPPLDSSFVAAIKPHLSTLNRIEEVKGKIHGNLMVGRDEVLQSQLEDMCVRMRNAYCDLVVHMVKGLPAKGKLKEFLTLRGVPEWLHTKFSTVNLPIEKNTDLWRVLFPKDPSKGLALTFREWRDETFLGKLPAEWLHSSRFLLLALNDEEFLRTLTGLAEEVPFNDETNPVVQKLQSTRVLVVPSPLDSARVTEPGAAIRQGWKFPATNLSSPAAAVSSLGVAFMRVYSANLQSVDLLTDFYSVIVPGAVTKAATTPSNNFYSQWARAELPSTVWSRILSFGPDLDASERQHLFRWLRAELRLSESAPIGRALAALTVRTGTVNIGTIEEPNVVDMAVIPRARILPAPQRYGNIGRPIQNSADRLQVREFTGTYLSSVAKGKKKKSVRGIATTRLSRVGKEAVTKIKRGISMDLADRVEDWLRSFSQLRLQETAAEMLLASFDSIIGDDEVGSSLDGSDSESDRDEE